MMRDGTPAYSNFAIASKLTEIILLGCVAMRVGPGKKMQWDGKHMKSPNCPEAAQYLRRHNRKAGRLETGGRSRESIALKRFMASSR